MRDAGENSGIQLRAVLLGAAAIVLAIALALLIAYLFWARLRPAGPDGGPNAAFDFKVTSPRLESAPQPERADYLAEKNRLLQSWQWIDKPAGIARIPMDAAMQLMVRDATRQATQQASDAEQQK